MIDEALKEDSHQRDSKWTEIIAVGSKSFVEHANELPGVRENGRKIDGHEDAYELRETSECYGFSGKKGA